MSKSLNSVNLTGYLGAEPKIHTFPDGTQVANLRLAVARQKKEHGEYVDDTIWMDVSAFGAQAGVIATYLTKGSFVAVSGQLAQPRQWQGDDGVMHCSIVVDHALVTFGPRHANTEAEPRVATPVASPQPAGPGDDDIPF